MKEILLKGIIGWEVTAEDIRKQLPAGKEAVRLLINSEGGEIFEAFEIYNMLKEYPGKVTARVIGLAASAAADLFFGADEREWFSHAAVLYHRAWSIAMGNAHDFREEADILDSLDRIRFKDFCRVTGKPLEQAEKEFSAETWLIGDEQIRGAGISGVLVDGEVPEEPPTDLAVAKKRVQDAQALLETRRTELDRLGTLARRRASIKASIESLVNGNLSGGSPNNHQTQEKGDAKVDFKEFLSQNPQAESEVLAYAKTKLGGENATAVKAETERIGKLLALGGIRLSNEIKAAIDNGKTVEEYAVAELAKQREIEAKLHEGNNLNPPGKVAQTLSEQTGKNAKTGPAGKEIDAMTEDEMAELLAGRYGRGMR